MISDPGGVSCPGIWSEVGNPALVFDLDGVTPSWFLLLNDNAVLVEITPPCYLAWGGNPILVFGLKRVTPFWNIALVGNPPWYLISA